MWTIKVWGHDGIFISNFALLSPALGYLSNSIFFPGVIVHVFWTCHQFSLVCTFKATRAVSCDGRKCLVTRYTVISSSTWWCAWHSEDCWWFFLFFIFCPFSLSCSGKIHVGPLYLYVFHDNPWFFFILLNFFYKSFDFFQFHHSIENWSYVLFFILTFILLIFSLIFCSFNLFILQVFICFNFVL